MNKQEPEDDIQQEQIKPEQVFASAAACSQDYSQTRWMMGILHCFRAQVIQGDSAEECEENQSCPLTHMQKENVVEPICLQSDERTNCV